MVLEVNAPRSVTECSVSVSVTPRPSNLNSVSLIRVMLMPRSTENLML